MDDDITNLDEPEQPPKQMAKDVDFMFCEPCHADQHLTGEPVAVVTLGFLGEIEAPLIFKLTDAKKLAFSLLKTLAYFDDESAINLMSHVDSESDDA
jgi:hypothetical protein